MRYELRAAPNSSLIIRRFVNEAVYPVSMVGDVNRYATEAEQVEQVADRRSIVRHIRIGRAHYRVGHIVPAAVGDRTETPVPLDEFEDGDVIRIVVRDVPALV